MKVIKLYLGLDVHKGSITIAIAPAGRSNVKSSATRDKKT